MNEGELLERLRIAEADSERLKWAVRQIPKNMAAWKHAYWGDDHSLDSVRRAIDFSIKYEARMARARARGES